MLTRWGVGACYTSTTADARLHLPKHAAPAWRSSDGPLIHAVAHPCLLTVIRRGVAAVLILRLPWQGPTTMQLTSKRWSRTHGRASDTLIHTVIAGKIMI
jgi:hypothetical protein